VPGAMSSPNSSKIQRRIFTLAGSLGESLWRTVNWWNDWNEYVVATIRKGKIIGTLCPLESESTNPRACYCFENMQGQISCLRRFPHLDGARLLPLSGKHSNYRFEGNPKPAAEELSKIWKTMSLLL